MARFCRHLLSLILATRMWLCASGELVTGGLNVCDESISVNLSRSIAETYISNVDCDGQQPPCQKSRYKTQYYIVPKNVLFCCIGWSRSGDECTRPCPTNTYGRGCNQTCNCINANTYCNPFLGCMCHAGYKPPNCTVPCDEGSYGYICTQKCTCLNDAACDPVNGTCSCTPGWMGADCNTTCPAGRFGADCHGNCSCDAGLMCDRAKGNCTLSKNTSSVVVESNVVESKDDSNEDLLWKLIVVVLGCIALVAIIVACVLCYTTYRQKNLIYTLTKRNEIEDETPTPDDLNDSQPGIQLTARTLVQTTHREPDQADSDAQYETRIAPLTLVELHNNEVASGQSSAHTNQLKLRPSPPEHRQSSRGEGSPFYCGIDDDDDDQMSGKRMQGFSKEIPQSANSPGGPKAPLQNIEHTYFTKD